MNYVPYVLRVFRALCVLLSHVPCALRAQGPHMLRGSPTLMSDVSRASSALYLSCPRA